MIRESSLLLPPNALEEAVNEAIAQARELRRPLLVSWVREVVPMHPIDVYIRAGARGEQRIFWSHQEGALALVGIGRLRTLQAEGDDRFQEIKRGWQALSAGALVTGISTPVTGTGPLLLGGFAFDTDRASHLRGSGVGLTGAPDCPSPRDGDGDPWQPFGDALFHLPRVLFTAAGGRAWVTFNAVYHPEEEPESLERAFAERDALWDAIVSQHDGAFGDRTSFSCEIMEAADGVPAASRRGEGAAVAVEWTVEDIQPRAWWQAAIAYLQAAMEEGRLTKAVIARQVRLQQPEPIDTGVVLGRLYRQQRNAYVFAVEEDARCFLGATPEQLVRLRGRQVHVAGVAGSIRRGRDDAEDRHYGELLLADGKNRREHAAVVDTLRSSLMPLCDMLHVPDAPQLLKTPAVQHLYTPVRGCLRDGVSIFDVAAALHPTPAVCGSPRPAAFAELRRCEPFDRGWYAGAVGWVDHEGDGEFCVALRSGLVWDREAILFTGCGIMPDSNADDEYEESCLKLQTMLAAFGSRGEGLPRWT